MKTTALTVGAVALLSQGKALGQGEVSSTLTIVTGTKGVVRTLPSAPPPSLTWNDPYTAFTALIEIISPLKDPDTCRVPYDQIEYCCKLDLLHPQTNQILPNSSIAMNRYFIAWTDTLDKVVTAETTTPNSTTTQQITQETYDWVTAPATLGGIDYYVGIQVKRTACGGNVVGVCARLRLKKKSNGQIINGNYSPARETAWQPCVPQ
ncbi:MAG: hypothetical protein J0M04_21430 [Verrucomicrobia bacterium]|nr:hypothetical protein [Verrucomicrobiota bacterium]